MTDHPTLVYCTSFQIIQSIVPLDQIIAKPGPCDLLVNAHIHH